MKTAVVEKDAIGGRCLNYACIPAKAVLRVADVAREVGHGGDFGIKVDGPRSTSKGVEAHRDKVIKTLTGGVVDAAQEEQGRRDRGRRRRSPTTAT